MQSGKDRLSASILHFSGFVSMYHFTGQHKLTQDFVPVSITFHTFQCSYIVLLWKTQSEQTDVAAINFITSNENEVVHINQYN